MRISDWSSDVCSSDLLHRVWVVEANLRPGTSHTFKTRRFYIDEDGWTIAAVDDYDNRDQLYQFQEGHIISAPNIQAATTVPEVIYHFTSGRYFITAAWNEDQPIDSTLHFNSSSFPAPPSQKITTRQAPTVLPSRIAPPPGAIRRLV